MDVQTLRMLVWWIAGGKCPEMMKIVGILGIPRILLILSIYWLYYPQPALHKNRRGEGSSNLKKPNTPMSKFACQAELQESLPSCLLSTRWKWDKTATSDEGFCVRILTHNLQTTNRLCLMSRTLSPDELILLLSLSPGIGVSSTGARISP